MIKLRTALATAAAFGVIATSGLTFAQGFPGGGMGSMGGFGGLSGALGGLSGEGYAHGFSGGGAAQGHSWKDRDGGRMRARGGSVTGTVASVSGSQSITLSEPDQATATLPLAANVTVRAAGQSSASLTDVAAGDSVVLQLNGNAEVTSIFVPANQGSTAPTTSGVATVAVSPDPIAATGSLSAGQAVTLTVAAENSAGQAVAGGTVDLSFNAATGGGSAAVDGTALTATPAAFTAGSDGTVSVTYTAPATLPANGTDVLTAANAVTSPTATATDSYTFGSATTPVSGVATVAVSPNPMAATGSLSAGQAVTVAVYAENANGQAVPGGIVDLSFTAAAGGGSASADGTALTATPTAFTTGSDGTIDVTYTAPSTLPASGTDMLTAANAATSPTATATDGYTFGSAATQTVSGSIVSVSNTITVVADGQTVSYPLAANVSVTGANGQATTLASLDFGQNVTLTLSQGSVTAISVVS